MYRILIVEDEEKISDAIKKSLEKWGFEVYKIKDFNKVFEEFLDMAPQLVLMDINLPAYDGFHWCSKLRNVSKVPVIFISSRSTNMDIVMAVNMGGDDYIIKPFSMQVLVAKINAVLRRTYSYVDSAMDVIECKSAVLSLKDNMLYYQGENIELTKNEFKILYMLMRNYGTIISREDIMQELWQDENFIDDNTLTVNINRLRKKLNQVGLNSFIRTIINQGYVIK
ncbi:response regulator transcription factor [Clostridium oryzae]|uniref:Stage 0 sporulation protein A homolog n=1 Tax=Clostridium oryzae TaxID=1450648 RepID=A0A1V4ICW8_9CLOT|nr:response regulator transcription factor [Clostridium oryzae]OPJ57730.1 response regulator protein GraR [Clostridium oryzae]